MALVTFILLVASVWPSSAYIDVNILDAQFLNMTQELKHSIVYENYQLKLVKYHHADPTDQWYEVLPHYNEEKAQKFWKNIETASELTSTKESHSSVDVELDFNFSFFGRAVSNLTLTTAGGILTGDKENKMQVPSHIAPFLSLLPPGGQIEVLYFSTHHSFTAQWSRRYVPKLHLKQQIQVTIYDDGSIVFLYKNLHPDVFDALEASGYPLVIGLQDGFVTPIDWAKTMDVFVYPRVLIDPKSLTNGKLMMVTMTLKNNDCRMLDKEESCLLREDDCVFCDVGCVFYMETERTGFVCNAPGEKTQTTEAGVSCPTHCPYIYEPTCGSDGITYNSECELKAFACENKADLQVASRGMCGATDVSTDVTTDVTTTDVSAIADADADDCQSKACTKEFAPVCGTDEVTYANKCVMEASNCALNVTLAHEGKCSKDYDYGSQHDDEDDVEHEGEEDCDMTCENVKDDPVCLNNDRQFMSKCSMDVAVCKQNLTIKEYYKGECHGREAVPPADADAGAGADADGRIDCTGVRRKGCPKIYHPVCGSNGLTYANECVLTQLVCVNRLDVSIAHEGECSSDGTSSDCDADADLAEMCTGEQEPVCGSDGKTYSNRCLFDVAKRCGKTGGELRLVKETACEDGVERKIKTKSVVHEEITVKNEEGEKGGHTLGRLVKGAVFLALGFAIAFMATVIFTRKSAARNLAASASASSDSSAISTSSTSMAATPTLERATPRLEDARNNSADGVAASGATLTPTSSSSLDTAEVRGRPTGPKYDQLPLVTFDDENRAK